MSRRAHPAFRRLTRAGAVAGAVTAALARQESRASRALRGLEGMAVLGDCGLGGLLAELSLAAALDREPAASRRVETDPDQGARPISARSDPPASPQETVLPAAAGPEEQERMRPGRTGPARVDRAARRPASAARAADAGPRAALVREASGVRSPGSTAHADGRDVLHAAAERAGAADRRVSRERSPGTSTGRRSENRATTARWDIEVHPIRGSLTSSPAGAGRPGPRLSTPLEGLGARLGRAVDRALAAAPSSRRLGLGPELPPTSPASRSDRLTPEIGDSGLWRLAARANPGTSPRPVGPDVEDDPPLPQAAIERLEDDLLGARMSRLLRREAIRDGIEVNGVTL